jgi:hypothetical protein
MYRNRKGKRRIGLTLTGKEARWLYAVAYAERGDTTTPDWTVFDVLADLMEFTSGVPRRQRDMLEIPEVRWFDPETGR